jgi:hypothetical protein
MTWLLWGLQESVWQPATGFAELHMLSESRIRRMPLS